MKEIKTTLILLIVVSASFAQFVKPQLPDVSGLQHCIPDTSGYTTITVGPAGRDYTNFQQALNAAQLGTIIKLDAGVTFTGNFTLPNVTTGKPNGWIIITGSQQQLLPAENKRIEPDMPTGNNVFPTQESVMPKIVSANSAPAFSSAYSAHHYRFIGVEISYTNTANGIWNLVLIGDNYSNQSLIPHHFIFDRCYIHGLDNIDCTRGVFLNADSSVVKHSHISNFHQDGYDTQAIAVCWSNGTLLIYDNHLSATGEIIFFGGGGIPIIQGLIPKNIEIRNNHLFKPLKWYAHHPSYAGIKYTIKSNFEIKAAQKVLFDGNIIENQWPGGGHKFCINIQAATGQSGAWVQTNDITITNNILKNCVGGASMGRNYSEGSLNRILVENNLIYNMKQYYGYQNGYGLESPFFIFSVADSIGNATINHNTVINEDVGFASINILSTYGKPSANFYFINNLVFHGPYGIKGDGANSGTSTYDLYFPPHNTTSYAQRLTHNVLINNTHNIYVPGSYPGSNYFPDSSSTIGFVDYVNGLNDYNNYALVSTSPFANKATDGKDIGVDMTKLSNSLSSNLYSNCMLTSIQKQNTNNNDFTISPNPANDELNIVINKQLLNVNTNVVLCDISGAIIKKYSLSQISNTIKLEKISNGIYFIQLQTESQLITKKVIIQN